MPDNDWACLTPRPQPGRQVALVRHTPFGWTLTYGEMVDGTPQEYTHAGPVEVTDAELAVLFQMAKEAPDG